MENLESLTLGVKDPNKEMAPGDWKKVDVMNI